MKSNRSTIKKLVNVALVSLAVVPAALQSSSVLAESSASQPDASTTAANSTTDTSASATFAKQEVEFTKSLADAVEKAKAAGLTIKDGEVKTFQSTDEAKAFYEEQAKALGSTLTEYEKAKADYESSKTAYDLAVAANKEKSAAYTAAKTQYEKDLAAYKTAKAAYEAKVAEAAENDATYAAAKAAYDKALANYNAQKAAYDKAVQAAVAAASIDGFSKDQITKLISSIDLAGSAIINISGTTDAAPKLDTANDTRKKLALSDLTKLSETYAFNDQSGPTKSLQDFYKNVIDGNVKDEKGSPIEAYVVKVGDTWQFKNALSYNGEMLTIKYTLTAVEHDSTMPAGVLDNAFIGLAGPNKMEMTSMFANKMTYKLTFLDSAGKEVALSDVLVGNGDLDWMQYIQFKETPTAAIYGSNVTDKGSNLYQAANAGTATTSEPAGQLWTTFKDVSSLTYSFGFKNLDGTEIKPKQNSDLPDGKTRYSVGGAWHELGGMGFLVPDIPQSPKAVPPLAPKATVDIPAEPKAPTEPVAPQLNDVEEPKAPTAPSEAISKARVVTTVWQDESGKVLKDLVEGTQEKGEIKDYIFVETKTDENGNTIHIFKQLHTDWVTEDGKSLKEQAKGLQEKGEFKDYTYVKTETDKEGNLKHIFKPVAKDAPAEKPKEALPQTNDQKHQSILVVSALAIVASMTAAYGYFKGWFTKKDEK